MEHHAWLQRDQAMAAEDTIKICVIDDASGDLALPVILKTAGRSSRCRDNCQGGVLGKKLELIDYDGQSDVRRHEEFAQRCILEDDANVVMAGYTSSEREAPARSRLRARRSSGTTIKARGHRRQVLILHWPDPGAARF